MTVCCNHDPSLVSSCSMWNWNALPRGSE